MRRLAFFCSLALALLPIGALSQDDQALGEVLKANSVPFPPISIPHLNTPITSYATLNDDQEFLIAYYVSRLDRLLKFPLYLARFNKQTGKWDHAALDNVKVKISNGANPAWENDCIGSALSIERNGGWYYVALHWNPSAGCTIILTHDFSVSQTLTGGVSAFFKSGLLVYSGNTVHFADVHPETLWLYDPSAHDSTKIYPPESDPFRQEFSARLKEIIDDQRCRTHNCACDPERFGSDINGAVSVNDETQSLAFHISFTTEGFLTREEAEDSGKWDDDDYVYFYRFNPLEWREFSVYDLKPKFGTDSLEDLLTPDKLSRVFASPQE